MCVCCRLCSLAQDAKQETEDSTSLKKNCIKPEPATSEEEEAADTKHCSIAEENNVDTKPPLGKCFCLVFPAQRVCRVCSLTCLTDCRLCRVIHRRASL